MNFDPSPNYLEKCQHGILRDSSFLTKLLQGISRRQIATQCYSGAIQRHGIAEVVAQSYKVTFDQILLTYATK